MSLPREVEELSARYLAHASDHVHGAYVIGSAALGDWWAGASDIDLVALVASVDPVHDERLREIHARVRADPGTGVAPDLEVVYLTDGDLAQAPPRVGARPHHRAGLLRRDADMATPVVWHSLAQHGVPVAGSAAPGEIRLDDAELRAWCRSNLASYWARWASRGAQTASRAGMALLTDWAVCWCVLGVLRLRHTIDTGDITSKSGAGQWALEALALDPSERALVVEALSLRRAPADGPAAVREHSAPTDGPAAGREQSAARRKRTVAFMRRIIDETAEGP